MGCWLIGFFVGGIVLADVQVQIRDLQVDFREALKPATPVLPAMLRDSMSKVFMLMLGSWNHEKSQVENGENEEEKTGRSYLQRKKCQVTLGVDGHMILLPGSLQGWPHCRGAASSAGFYTQLQPNITQRPLAQHRCTTA